MQVFVLVQALEDLQEELRRWSSAASDAIRVAEHKQRHGQENVRQMMHRTAIALDQALQDQYDHDSLAVTLQELLERCTEGKRGCAATRAEAVNVLGRARATLAHWEQQLAAALEWLARAEHRLQLALEDLNAAQAELQSAEYELDSAISAYNRCIDDQNRKDCSGPRSRVERAEARVHAAQAWVYRAQAEVQAARHEVALARARVACCREAVSYSQQAVQVAQSAFSNAEFAVNAAERALEFAFASQRFLTSAQEEINLEKLAAQDSQNQALEAEARTEESRLYFINADLRETEGQRYATGARYRLSEKAEILRDFDTGSTVFK
jgi:chromosome segregation ATPase